MTALNATHDIRRTSWLAAANRADCDFPIQNLPFGMFRHGGGRARPGVAIGDRILDLAAAAAAGLFAGEAAVAAHAAAAGPRLNALMALGQAPASALRARLSDLLRADGPERARLEAAAGRVLVPLAEAALELPAEIGDFTDFLTSIYHTERSLRAVRPDAELPPAFKHLPIAYHSRASSVRASGEPVRRPNGQARGPAGVRFGASQALDFELELGCFIGPGNALGEPIALAAAEAQIFGYCLVNDWSARDLQRWESNPLGPFLSKSLSTTVSPWVVTAEAMAPFRAPAFARAAGDPPPPAYLASTENAAAGSLDLAMEAFLLTPRLGQAGAPPARVSATNFRHVYWTFAQMIAHHASNGCNLRPGDLLASGTVSGPEPVSRACMNELTVAGTEPLTLPGGETRAWLADGDEAIFRARASRAGCAAIGFGECRARIDPAPAWPG